MDEPSNGELKRSLERQEKQQEVFQAEIRNNMASITKGIQELRDGFIEVKTTVSDYVHLRDRVTVLEGEVKAGKTGVLVTRAALGIIGALVVFIYLNDIRDVKENDKLQDQKIESINKEQTDKVVNAVVNAIDDKINKAEYDE